MKIMKYNQLINQARVDGQMTDKKTQCCLGAVVVRPDEGGE